MIRKLGPVLSIVFITFPALIFGQSFQNIDAEKIISGSSQVVINEKNKSVKYFKLRTDAAKSFAANQPDWLNKSLKFSKNHNLRLAQKTTDQQGIIHDKYQIYFKDIPIEGAIYSIHSKNGQTYSANGEYVLGNNIRVTPQIKESQAYENAINYINAIKYYNESESNTRPEGLLVILPVKESYVLCYKFDIYALEPLSRNYVFVDANTGQIIKTINRICNDNVIGKAVTLYNDTINFTTDSYKGTFRLRESGRGDGIETYNLRHNIYRSNDDFTDNDNYWDNIFDRAACDVHYGTETTYDFYFNRFGRNSFDNKGSKIYSYVHYGTNYVNAFWDGSCAVYGDGDNFTYGPLTCLDIIGHEITHGVTERSAGLIYSEESGALNESFSDIMGVSIDFYKHPATANFYSGDQCDLKYRKGFRNMANPNEFSDPDTYKGRYWDFEDQEVHINSGVQNFWFYLLCMGGSGTNDIANRYQVDSIGINKASAIAYRTLTIYLTPSSNYADARFYSIIAAEDLYGSCSKEVKSVANAWYAVGVGVLFDDAVTAGFTSSVTEACSSPATIYFYNQSSRGSSYIWNFGDGNMDTTSNPGHTFNNAGNYTVQLIAKGTTLCNHTDTIKKTGYITVANSQFIVAPACVPLTINKGSGGIYHFELNTIDKNTSGSKDNYRDYSCTDSTTVKEGRRYSVSIKVGDREKENACIWLDMNNNGQFEEDELIFKKEKFASTCSDSIIIPAGSQYDVPLRLRVITDMADYPIKDACTNSNYGQAQDYTVIVRQNNSAPEIDFKFDRKNIISGDTVCFKDNSLNSPDLWLWNFPGGTPSSSTLKNPEVVYDTPGTYDVTFTATNGYGSGSVTRTGLINVSTPAPLSLTAILKNQATGEVSLKWYNSNNEGLFVDFDDGLANNFVFSTDSFSVNNGSLKVKGVGDGTWKNAYYDKDFQDFTFEYKFKREQLSNTSSVGAFVRAQGFLNDETNRSGYLVNVLPIGSYSVWKISNEVVENLIPWTSTNTTNNSSGSWNVVTIQAIGNSFKIFANGRFIDEFNDNTYYSGKISVTSFFDFESSLMTSWDYFNILTNGEDLASLNLPKAINMKLTGESDYTKSPVSFVNKKAVDVKGIINENNQRVSNAFKYYKLYRDDKLIDSTKYTSYSDKVPTYGLYKYRVTSVYDAGESASANITLFWADPFPGDKCNNAQDLAELTSPYNVTTVDYTEDFDLCNTGTAPDRIFYIDVPGSSTLKIGQVENDFDSRYTLRIGGSCPGNIEIACVDEPDIQTHYYTNNSDTIQRLYFILLGFETESGNSKLSWELIAKAKPVADFLVKASSIKTGTLVYFSDASKNLPTAWKWSFPGGYPASSTEQNPHVLYDMAGIYKVSLIVSNVLGSDTIVKESFMQVGNHPGENCDNAQNLANLTSPLAGSMDGYNAHMVIGGMTPIADRMFYIDVPAGNELVINETTGNSALLFSLRVGGNCPGTSEISCVGGGYNRPISYVNSSKVTERAYLLLGFYNFNEEWPPPENSTFNMEWNLTTPKVPVADFASDTFLDTLYYSMQYTNLSTGAPSSYKWYFQGGEPSMSDQKDLIVIYYKTGTYTVKLVVSNMMGADSLTKIRNISFPSPTKPLANFYSSSTNVFPGTGISFDDNSANNPVTRKWTFTGGMPSVSFERFPYIVYNTPGDYDVKLVVANSGGSDSIIRSGFITVIKPTKPLADFYTNDTNILKGTKVRFTDNSLNNPTSWHWYFEGGSPTSSSSDNPVVTYNIPGTYYVKMVATNSLGSDTITKGRYIKVSDIQNPVADFYATKTNLIVDESVSFYDNSSNTPTSWQWNFPGGDPTTSTLKCPMVFYADTGTFEVQMVATNTKGSSTVIKKGYIRVSTPPKPVANFYSYLRENTVDYANVYFNDLSLNSPDLWHWTFKEAEPSYSYKKDPISINYNKPGYYDVKMVVSNDGGSDSIIKKDYIYISKPDLPIADFKTNTTSISKGDEIYFLDLCLNATSVQWTFEGGTPSVSNEIDFPLVKYNTSGSYSVKLVVKNSAGADSIVKTNYIIVADYKEIKPITDFYSDYRYIYTETSVNFYDQTLNKPTSWQWTFDGGTPAISSDQNPSVIYNQPGYYDVKLVASNTMGSDTFILPNFIHVITPPKPTGYFYTFEKKIAVASSINFYSYVYNNPSSWKWIFQGGTPATSSDKNPVVQYNTPGIFDVMLILSNAHGVDSIFECGYLTVPKPKKPVADFYLNRTNIYTGWYVYFRDNSENYPTSWNWTFEGGEPSKATGSVTNAIYYYKPGNYNVKLVVSNVLGSDSIVKQAYVSVSYNPQPTPSFTADIDRICEGGDLTFSSSSQGHIKNYIWEFGEDAIPQFAFTEGPHKVSYPTPGTKTVTLTLNSISSVWGNYNVNAYPPAPIISQKDDKLYSSSFFGNQWYSTTEGKINEATDFIFKPLKSDNYFAIVNNEGCPSDSSNIIDFTVTAIDFLRIEMKFYPNPVKDNLVIESEELLKSAVINDLEGRIIQTINFPGYNTKYILNFSSFKPGIYNIKFISEKGTANYRILKIE
jgi:PKD repeat protein